MNTSRGVGKELWSVTLDKGGCRCTDAYNEVRLLFSEERAEIRDERNLRVFIAGTGRHKRMVSDVQLPRRLPLQLAANGPGILAPGFELLTKGMQKHYPLGVGRGGSPHAKSIVKTKNNPTQRQTREAFPLECRLGRCTTTPNSVSGPYNH